MIESRSGKMPTTSVGADLAVEPLVGVVRPDLAPERLGERGEGQDLLAGGLEVGEGLGELVLEGLQDAVELGVHGLGVGWSKTVLSRVLTQGQELLGVVAMRLAA